MTDVPFLAVRATIHWGWRTLPGAPSSSCAILQTGGNDGALQLSKRRSGLHARHVRMLGQCRRPLQDWRHPDWCARA